MSDDRNELDDERELEHDEDEEALTGDDGEHAGVSFFAGFVVGALLGIGAALLFAPARGEVTRKRLRHRLQSLKEGAADRLGDARDAAERELRRQRRRLRRHLPHR